MSGVKSKVWGWSMGSLQVALYRAGHRGWPLGARGRLFPERCLGSGLAPDHKQTKKIIKRFTTELFRRAPFADQTFANGLLPTDISQCPDKASFNKLHDCVIKKAGKKGYFFC